MKYIYKSVLIFAILLNSISLFAQTSRATINGYFQKEKDALALTANDIGNWRISSEFTSKDNISYTYVQQTYKGFDVLNAMCNFTISKDKKVLNIANTFVKNVAQKINTTDYTIDKNTALNLALEFKNLSSDELIRSESNLIYYQTNSNELKLSHHVTLYVKGMQHVWSVIIDGENGETLKDFDQVLHCHFGEHGFGGSTEAHHSHQHAARIDQDEHARRAGAYNVFAIPVESPVHGNQSLVNNPADPNASPYGWHDIDGSEGEEFTITRGNNVFAYEDINNSNFPGYSPDGGPGLNFDFPYTVGAPPLDNLNAAITNLFYMSNIVHDIYYNYGFDEASGNFQSNNYGNGGNADDEVIAEALDGSGLNNAIFFTPVDGQSPRMQMFLWRGAQGLLHINSPSNISGTYTAAPADFGPEISTTNPITGDLALYNDGVDPINDACEDPINPSELAGKIVVIDRNVCTFVSKVLRAQDAGAIAVIIVNNIPGPPTTLGGNTNAINIPSLMVSMEDGEQIKAALANTTVNSSIIDSTDIGLTLDGDFDNGIIAHEYGHGISTRLIGGRFNTFCLFNDEQMGEGWSDWFGLMITMNMNVENPVYRQVGAFVRREDPSTGFGIRPAPYDTSFAVNDFTYGDIDQLSIPHGVGFVWSTILWDLTWALIDEYGFDPDIYNGQGGNNMAMKLVINALKIINCSPGFVNGRNSILMADAINYGGANECLIWKVFARRGLGFGASQGSSSDVSDGNESFEIPESCMNQLEPDFIADKNFSCDGTIQFTNTSIGDHDTWNWDFGDNNSSTEENPLHHYESSGNYTVTLTISNGTNSEDIVKTEYITIAILEAPTAVSDIEGCIEDSFTLTALSNNTLFWFSQEDNLLATGNSFETPPLSTNTTYQVADVLINGNDTCMSEKLPLTVFISDANFETSTNGLTVNFIDLSTNATSWEWEFGDGNSSTAQNPTHTYTSGGLYEVELSINNKLCAFAIEVDLTTVGFAETFAKGKVDILPNPANNSALVQSDIKFPENSIVQLIAIDGRIIKEEILNAAVNSIELDLKAVESGTYSVVVSLENKKLLQRKLIVFKR